MKYFLIFTISFLLGVIFIGTYDSQKMMVDKVQAEEVVTKTVAEVNNLTGQLQICEEFNPFMAAVDKIGSIPYNASFDNCYDHSKQLTAALAKDNIYSTVMVNKDRSHAWVAVWIEATTGHFIKPSEAQPLLEVRDGVNPINVMCYQK